jgi:hypothetical protein
LDQDLSEILAEGIGKACVDCDRIEEGIHTASCSVDDLIGDHQMHQSQIGSQAPDRVDADDPLDVERL